MNTSRLYQFSRRLKPATAYIPISEARGFSSFFGKTIVADGKSQTFGVFVGSLESITDSLQIGVKAGGGKYRSVAIADVRLWNVCRPQDQIKANMSRRLNSDVEKDNGLIGYWRLDEGSDDRVINLVSKTPATIHGAKWFPMPVVPEQTTPANTNLPES